MEPRPRVLCVVDCPNWAHDRKTDALARVLAPRYEIVKRYQADVTAEDLTRADVILLYYWLQFDRLGPLASLLHKRGDRLAVGICSHYELEGAWNEPGLSLLATVPRAVFANNLTLVRQLAPKLRRSIFYTPNGVDTTFFRPADVPRNTKGLRVGWAGSLNNQTAEHRGVHEVIAPAVAMVGDAEFCMAAREEHWRGLEEMRSFYQSLDVYVCASRSEGTPNPCLEAAACGLTVVTTPVGNMPELIRHGENGFFITRDPEDVAAKLQLLRDEPRLRLQMGASARKSIEPWDWHHQATRYDEMFRTILSDGAAPAPQ